MGRYKIPLELTVRFLTPVANPHYSRNHALDTISPNGVIVMTLAQEGLQLIHPLIDQCSVRFRDAVNFKVR